MRVRNIQTAWLRFIADEEKCKCGSSIPKGYGYYNYGKSIRCFNCGRTNTNDERG